MGKKVGGVSWRAVALEGVPMDGAALEGFIGLEECTDYDLDTKSEGKRKIKQKKPKQAQKGPTPSLALSKSETVHTFKNTKNTKNAQSHKTEEPVAKRTKLTNGFVVETCVKTKPSTDSDSHESGKTTLSNGNSNKENAEHTLGLDGKTAEHKLGVDDMQAWSQFQVPEEILKALAEQGFDKPTKIQELCLPPAMLGRRDILGAAETGSGKTLAFAIPILAGIMKLKENEKAGLDVYDARYKKTSVKRNKPTKEKATKIKERDVKKPKRKHVKNNTAKTITNGDDEIGNSEDEAVNVKNIDDENREEHESDEGIDSEGENSDNETQIQNNDHKMQNDDNESESSDNETQDDDNNSESNNETQTDDNATEHNDEDDSDDNYIHLSDVFDSDDLEDSSDEENDKIIDPDGSGDEIEDNNELNDESVSDEEEVNADKVGEGIGCVKVVDDVELPPRRVVKTGRPLYALVVTPTRELAMQISRHMISAAKYTGIRVAVLVGGMARVKQERVLAGGPEVVVCTPGRLWELLQQGEPHLQQLDHIKFLAIDETDRMLERNHFEELQPLLERLNADERRRADRQSFVMSATLTMTHDLPSHLRGKKVTKRGKIINRKVQKMTPQQKTKRLIAMLGMTDPKIVDLTAENHGTAGTLTECRITCALEHKDYYLFYVLRTHPGRTIVFCNSIGCVKRLAQLFSLLKCRPLPLHAGMPQRQRLKNLERFRDDPHGVLVATDVAARGLDIPNVDHVIHYQVPRTAENYVHRSGRTARANKEGLTILMMEPGEAYLYSKLSRTLNKTTELPEFPVPERVLASMRACVNLARDVEAAALAGKRRAQESGWLERVARECDLVVDNDFLPMKKQLDSHDAAATTKALQHKKKQLEAMLTKPMFPKGFSYKYPGLNDANALVIQSEENALQAMKRVVETGVAKKERRKSKNAPLLSLEKKLQPKRKESKKGGKVEKRRKKKFYKKS